MKFFNITDPANFRSQTYTLKCSPLGIMELEPIGEPVSFVEMQKKRKLMSPGQMREQFEQGSIPLANVGVTVYTVVLYQGVEYAVFTVRPNGQLAHICGYTQAGIHFADMAKAKLAEELIVKQGDRYLSNTNLPFAYASVVDIDIMTWPIEFEFSIEQTTLLPPAGRGSARLISDGQLIQGIDADAPNLFKLGFYLDPFTTSAQRLFTARIVLPDLPITLLQTEERLKKQSDGSFVLVASEGAPMWLFPMVDGEVDATRAFNLIDGELCAVDASQAAFHQGMSSVDIFGICQSEQVLATNLKRSRMPGSTLSVSDTALELHALGYHSVPLALVSRACESREQQSYIAYTGYLQCANGESCNWSEILASFCGCGVPEEVVRKVLPK